MSCAMNVREKTPVPMPSDACVSEWNPRDFDSTETPACFLSTECVRRDRESVFFIVFYMNEPYFAML